MSVLGVVQPRLRRWSARKHGHVIHSSVFLGSTPRGPGRVEIDAHTTVQPNALLAPQGGVIRVGKHCSINDFCALYGSKEPLVIGDWVRVAAGTTFVPENHRFDDLDMPIATQGYISTGIVVGNDVWIGANCTILDGVTIGNGCVVAAGSVVTRSIPARSIAMGVPARVVRTRQ